MMKANNQLGFININEDSIDKIIKDDEVIFERGFLREKTSTTLSTTFGGVGKDLKDYKVYGNTVQSKLPSGYTQVDYIESSGTQYIDTGVNADINLDVKIDMQYTDINASNNDTNFGALSHVGNSYTRYHINKTGGGFLQAFVLSSSNSLSIASYNVLRHSYYIKARERKLYYDNQELSLPESLQTDTLLNFWLFGRNSNESNLIFYNSSKLYSCQMYYNDILVRDFIPCYRNSDNEVGLYDLVNKIFYTNQGTGTFTYGSIAPTPDAPIEIVSCGDRTKNLCFTDFNNWESGQYDTSGNKSIISSRIRLKDLLPVEPNTTYYFDTFDTTGATLTHTFFIRECDTNGNFINNVGTVNNQATITTGNTTHYLMATIGSPSAQTGENFESFQNYFEQGKIKPFICLNSEVDKSYEPYGYKIPVNVNNVITNIYLDEPLRKIEDYADYIDFKNNKLVRKIKEKILNGTEYWNISTNFYTVSITNYAYSNNIPYSNNFAGYRNISSVTSFPSEIDNVFAFKNRKGEPRLYLKATQFTTINELKAWLSTHNTIIDYVLVTPTEEDIELPNIPTIDGNNTLNIETEITSSKVYIKYKSNN